MWEAYFATGRGQLREEMVQALICREMGWTFLEYEQQPAHMIDILLQMMQAESKNMEKKNR